MAITGISRRSTCPCQGVAVVAEHRRSVGGWQPWLHASARHVTTPGIVAVDWVEAEMTKRQTDLHVRA